MATRRRYTSQEKAKAVQAAKNSSVGAVSARLNIPKARLYEWAKAADYDEGARDKIILDKHGHDEDAEVTPEMEQEAQAVLDNRRYEAELSLLQDEYDALRARYIELSQKVRAA